MSEEFGPDFVTLTDEDGNEIELEHIDTLEYNGNYYMAFFEAETEEKQSGESDNEVIILKVMEENGEELLATIDSEDELNAVYDLLMESLYEDDEEEPTD